VNRGTRRWLACVLLAGLAVAGAVCLAWQVGRAELFATPTLIDARYRDFLRLLPDESPFGYLSDIPRDRGDGDYHFYTVYYQAQYALAPHLVVDRTDYRYVIADLTEPSALPDICSRYGLEPVFANSRGDVVLLKHVGEP
jgi:hypothetical protein